jgi:hypothetical protein
MRRYTRAAVMWKYEIHCAKLDRRPPWERDRVESVIRPLTCRKCASEILR